MGLAGLTGRQPSAAATALVTWLRPRIRRRRRPLLLGLSGLQGSGKSTLASALVAAANASGLSAVAISLDDFYYGRRERLRLARQVHPLLGVRGVPGTHDLTLMRHTLQALLKMRGGDVVALPRFDKGRDTRLPPSRWRRLRQVPQLVVFEGWCLGVQPQADAELCTAVNALERNEDVDGRWRLHVNSSLRNYRPLWRACDLMVVLRAPSWRVVGVWRDEQEQARRDAGMPRALGSAALQRFLMFYERLSRHALRMLPARADLLIELNSRRRIRAINVRR